MFTVINDRINVTDRDSRINHCLLWANYAAGITLLVVIMLASRSQISFETAAQILTPSMGFLLVQQANKGRKAWSANESFVGKNKLPAKTIALFLLYIVAIIGPGLVASSLAVTGHLTSLPLLASLICVPLTLHLLQTQCFRCFPIKHLENWDQFLLS